MAVDSLSLRKTLPVCGIIKVIIQAVKCVTQAVKNDTYSSDIHFLIYS